MRSSIVSKVAILIWLGIASAAAEPALSDLDRALIGAAIIGSDKAVAELLSKGANPDVTDEDGWSAVTHAAATGPSIMFMRLYEHAKSIDLDNQNTSPFYIALVTGNRTLLTYFSFEDDITPRRWNDAAEFVSYRGDTGTMAFLTFLFPVSQRSVDALSLRLMLSGIPKEKIEGNLRLMHVVYLNNDCKQRGDYDDNVCYNEESVNKALIRFRHSRDIMHNGSLMSLAIDGDTVMIKYKEPRSALASLGVTSGTLLFNGRMEGSLVSGEAYTFRRGCSPAPYEVKGGITNDQGKLLLRGASPVRRRQACEVEGYDELGANSALEFSIH